MTADAASQQKGRTTMDNEKKTAEEQVEAAAKKTTISDGAKELDTRKTKRAKS